MATPRDNALGLLAKAESDLFVARTILTTRRALDTVCFHPLQAAEKSLKAVLASREVEYPWTHNLRQLLDLAKLHLPSIAEHENDIAMLTPFAVVLRYDFEFAPPYETAEAALSTAEGVYKVVRGFLQ